MGSYMVLGLGRFGQSCARTLAELGHQVLGVDRSEQIVQSLSDEITHVVQAEVDNEDFLKTVGIKNFDAAVVAIGDNIQSSIMATVLLKEHGAKYILAKAQNDLHAIVLYKVGADKVVFPERDMGIRAANNLISSNIIDMIEISPEYSIMEIKPPSSWVGKSIGDLRVRSKYGINIIAIQRNNNIGVLPRPDTTFEEQDVVAVIGKNQDLNNLRRIR